MSDEGCYRLFHDRGESKDLRLRQSCLMIYKCCRRRSNRVFCAFHLSATARQEPNPWLIAYTHQISVFSINAAVFIAPMSASTKQVTPIFSMLPSMFAAPRPRGTYVRRWTLKPSLISRPNICGKASPLSIPLESAKQSKISASRGRGCRRITSNTSSICSRPRSTAVVTFEGHIERIFAKSFFTSSRL